MTEDEIAKLESSLKEKDFQLDVLKSNCDLLEKQLADLTASHQEVLEQLGESEKAQVALADVVAKSAPRLESLKGANDRLKSENKVLTRLLALAQERARGVKNVLNG